MGSKKPFQRVRLKVKDFFINNPNATNAQAVSATGASPRTVSMARQELRDKGIIPANPNDRTKYVVKGTPGVGPDLDTLEITSTQELLESVKKEINEDVTDINDMNPVEMKRILSKIARSRVEHPTVRIAAIREKNRLDFETQDRHELGPGPPLTREAAEDRLLLLMEAIGPEIVVSCFEKFVAQIGVSNDSTEEMDSNDPPSLSSPPTQPSGSSTSIHPSPDGNSTYSIREVPPAIEGADSN